MLLYNSCHLLIAKPFVITGQQGQSRITVAIKLGAFPTQLRAGKRASPKSGDLLSLGLQPGRCY